MESQKGAVGALRVALVGCGKMGLNHVRAIQACPSATLVGVADPGGNPKKLEPLLPPGTRWFASAQELLLATKPDVVHIVTPPGTHAELALMCLRQGAHVYVEKPFTDTFADALQVMEAAQRWGLQVCAGHQLLFEGPAQALKAALPVIGRVVHVESYFSFKTVRKSKDGRSPMSPVEQLIDILPHPVYTMLNVLRLCSPDTTHELTSLDVDADGDVRALVRAGNVRAVLAVTLRGRPIESYLRVVGTNGSLRADFVRGTLIRLAGPGASAVSILSNPYREGKQIVVGSTKGFIARVRGKRKGYPGLNELFESFYASISSATPAPMSPLSILETVGVCEQVGQALRTAEREREHRAEMVLAERTLSLPETDESRGTVLVTGGTGTLGRAVLKELRDHGWKVRAASRRVPDYSSREAGIEYVAADLAELLDTPLFDEVATVVHCAAETAGDKDAHDRNTVHATRNLLNAAAGAGVKGFIQISSIAVLKAGRGTGLDERAPVDVGNLSRGPYVWAKAEAEREVIERGPALGLMVRVLRPGPLVDFQNFEAPGRLGRELGSIFLAVGPRSGRLSLCDVHTAARVIRSAVEDMKAAPPLLNLIEPDAPTRAELLARLLRSRPDLRGVWLPAWLLGILSPLAKVAQKIVRPRATPLDLAAAFSSERYNTSLAAAEIHRAQAGPPVMRREPKAVTA